MNYGYVRYGAIVACVVAAPFHHRHRLICLSVCLSVCLYVFSHKRARAHTALANSWRTGDDLMPLHLFRTTFMPQCTFTKYHIVLFSAPVQIPVRMVLKPGWVYERKFRLSGEFD